VYEKTGGQNENNRLWHGSSCGQSFPLSAGSPGHKHDNNGLATLPRSLSNHSPGGNAFSLAKLTIKF
jgi:hypothetical protein